MLISELITVVNQYYEFRELTEPTFQEAVKFAATEAGELLNASTKVDQKWVRNNPLSADEALKELRHEVADCLMMLVKAYEKGGFENYEMSPKLHSVENIDIEFFLADFCQSIADLYSYSVRQKVGEQDIQRCLLFLGYIAKKLDINPYDAMLEKFAFKGFAVRASC